MAVLRLQGKDERSRGVYYEFDSSEDPLGVGGMGKVYKGQCVDEKSGTTRLVAIKFMYDDLPAQVIERARREASIRIRHENLVEMLGFIETEGKNVLGETCKHYHVVSELLEGVMLDDLLHGKRQDRYGNVVPFADKLYNDYQRDPYHFAIYIIRNILSGLTTLHDVGYIHRDIDPTNIMLTVDGRVKLIDFGIAKQMSSLTSHDKALTISGAFMGKPEYAAPELVLGDIRNQSKVTDIYAVGVLMFQCIVGHPPFEGERQEILQMQLHKQPPLNLIRNKDVRRIIKTAMEKSRQKRYPSAPAFRVALDNLPLQLKDDLIVWKKSYTIAASVIAVGLCLGISSTVIWRLNDNVTNDTANDLREQSSLLSTQSQGKEETKTYTSSEVVEPKAVSKDYKSLYMEADQVYSSREGDRQVNLRKALALFEEALELAKAADDEDYVNKCEKKIVRVKKRID